MKGKEEVDRLLCRFEERFQQCLLFTQAIPVSFADRCYPLLIDSSASARVLLKVNQQSQAQLVGGHQQPGAQVVNNHSMA